MDPTGITPSIDKHYSFQPGAFYSQKRLLHTLRAYVLKLPRIQEKLFRTCHLKMYLAIIYSIWLVHLPTPQLSSNKRFQIFQIFIVLHYFQNYNINNIYKDYIR